MSWFILAGLALAWVGVTEACGYTSLHTVRRIRWLTDNNGSGSEYMSACEEADRNSVSNYRVASGSFMVLATIFTVAGIVQTYWWPRLDWPHVVIMVAINFLILAGVGYPIYRLQRWRDKHDGIR